MQAAVKTLDEMEIALGERLKALRLHRNVDQATVAARAGVSVRALRNLEAGSGSTMHTFLAVVRALGRETWLETIAPLASINPLTVPRDGRPRQRATAPSRSARTKAP